MFTNESINYNWGKAYINLVKYRGGLGAIWTKIELEEKGDNWEVIEGGITAIS